MQVPNTTPHVVQQTVGLAYPIQQAVQGPLPGYNGQTYMQAPVANSPLMNAPSRNAAPAQAPVSKPLMNKDTSMSNNVLAALAKTQNAAHDTQRSAKDTIAGVTEDRSTGSVPSTVGEERPSGPQEVETPETIKPSQVPEEEDDEFDANEDPGNVQTVNVIHGTPRMKSKLTVDDEVKKLYEEFEGLPKLKDRTRTEIEPQSPDQLVSEEAVKNIPNEPPHKALKDQINELNALSKQSVTLGVDKALPAPKQDIASSIKELDKLSQKSVTLGVDKKEAPSPAMQQEKRDISSTIKELDELSQKSVVLGVEKKVVNSPPLAPNTPDITASIKALDAVSQKSISLGGESKSEKLRKDVLKLHNLSSKSVILTGGSLVCAIAA
jgi:hypothetical protein